MTSPHRIFNKPDEGKKWYAIRLKYIRGAKFGALLPPSVGKCFVTPEVGSLVFIHSDFDTINDYRLFDRTGSHIGFMRDRSTYQPLTVKDKDMDIFMRICQASECPIVMTEKPKVKLGDRVRVVDGPFKGAEGNVVRIRKSKRILVNIADILWAATEFVSPDLLEVIEDAEDTKTPKQQT